MKKIKIALLVIGLCFAWFLASAGNDVSADWCDPDDGHITCKG